MRKTSIYRHTLLKKCRTRLGLHKPGEEGTFIAQGNGMGNFFPDRGGFAFIPCSHVKRVEVVHQPQRAYKGPPSLLQRVVKRLVKADKEREVRRVVKVVRRLVR